MHDIYSILTALGIYVPGSPRHRDVALQQWGYVLSWAGPAKTPAERIARAQQVRAILDDTIVVRDETGKAGLTWPRKVYSAKRQIVWRFVDLIQVHLKRSQRRYSWAWDRSGDGGPTKVLWLER